jgi:hypothetical protein
MKTQEEKTDIVRTVTSVSILVVAFVCNALGYYFLEKDTDVAAVFFATGLLWGFAAIVHGFYWLRRYTRQ